MTKFQKVKEAVIINTTNKVKLDECNIGIIIHSYSTY